MASYTPFNELDTTARLTAFVADCLETIEEIGEEYKEVFIEHGGERWQLVESLNVSDAWIKAVVTIIKERLPQTVSA
jgi:protoheme ferro-lyase